MAELSQNKEYWDIPLDQLTVSGSNVRQIGRLSDVDQLAKNIDEIGLQQPIVVVQVADRHYEVIIGQRRLEAFRSLERETIPARIVTDSPSELEIKARSFSENAQRVDLDPSDRASVCAYLVQKLDGVRQTAKYLGVSEPTVRSWLKLAEAPQSILDLVDKKEIRKGTATQIWIASRGNVENAEQLAELIAKEKPTPQRRTRLVTAYAQDPTQTPGEVEQRADALQFRLKIVIEFPLSVSRALESASDELDQEIDDIVLEATSAWLQEHQYVIGR